MIPSLWSSFDRTRRPSSQRAARSSTASAFCGLVLSLAGALLFAACSSTTTSDASGDFHALGADLDRYLDPIALEDFLQKIGRAHV